MRRTGANSGIGFATAKVIAGTSAAFHVIMTGRSLEKVESAKSEIEAAGTKGSLSALQLDVTDEKSVEQAAQAVEKTYERLDVLINNAGIAPMNPDIKTRLQRTLDTNVVGPAVVAAAFRPLLFKSQNPYSIYVSSGGGSLIRASEVGRVSMTNHIPYEESYRASKAALNMLAVQENFEFGAKGLKVFTMSPGLVISNLRGTDEGARTAWGSGAKDPESSGKTILSIIQGERDADAGKFVVKDGLYPW